MKKILIVEDNKDSREILSLFVTKFGHRVIKASNSQEAIAYAEAQCPDLIFMDLDLPDADGIKTTATLRQNPKHLTFPSWRLRHGSPHYGRKRLREWVSQPT
jgi:CheY-like chemotaxis protein